MEVIKKGKPWSKKVKCTGAGNGECGCGASLRVEKDDLFHTWRGYIDYSEDWFITFRCSECGVLTDIPDGATPFNASDLPHYTEWCKAHGIKPDKD